MLDEIKRCFTEEQVYYSEHARQEMEFEESGRIQENEVYEALLEGEVIEDYPEDEPYPSVLIFGRTEDQRPLHIVCGYSKENELAVVITVYEPDEEQWIEFTERK